MPIKSKQRKINAGISRAHWHPQIGKNPPSIDIIFVSPVCKLLHCDPFLPSPRLLSVEPLLAPPELPLAVSPQKSFSTVLRKVLVGSEEVMWVVAILTKIQLQERRRLSTVGRRMSMNKHPWQCRLTGKDLWLLLPSHRIYVEALWGMLSYSRV